MTIENNSVSSQPTQVALKTILLVDDDDAGRLLTKWFLGNFGFIVHASPGANEALALFNPRIHDLVITDNSMPGMTGVEMAHIIKMRSPSTPVLMHTSTLPADRSCLDTLLQKPAGYPTLKAAVDRLLGLQTPVPTAPLSQATSRTAPRPARHAP